MTMEVVQWHHLLQIMHETYHIWSPGLSKGDYHDFLWKQLNHPWGKCHLSYFYWHARQEITASCKYYRLKMVDHGKTYPIVCLGAVFVLKKHRGLGWAKKLVTDCIKMARKEDASAVLLFSDIGYEMYQAFGFHPLGNRQFSINQETVSKESQQSKSTIAEIRPVDEIDDPSSIGQHYRRWLASRPYGIHRSPEYCHYKLWRENYSHQNSRWNWPQLEIVYLPGNRGGYALFEHGDKNLRLLEIVGTESARLQLWQQIIDLAAARQCQQIRGWEALTIGCPVKFALTERSWGYPMILPLGQAANRWCSVKPCALLELDYF